MFHGMNCMVRISLSTFLFCIVLALEENVWPLRKIEYKDIERQQCDSKIYCKGPLLTAVQTANLFADCKQFVDMPGKFSEDLILEHFSKLGSTPSKEALLAFVTDNFNKPGHELRPIIPRDWSANPKFMKGIKDEKLKEFAGQVHSKWRRLLRLVDPRKICDKCVSSTIQLPNPFIVPGGRFRELYYWDSYWILEGLYVSGMCDTAWMTIDNFRFLISKYGLIPNGSRIYYLNRSHPPLFVQMFQRYLENCVHSDDKRKILIEKMLPFMEQEQMFWAHFRSVKLPHPMDPLRSLALNRYRADTELPRPESFLQDTLLTKSAGELDEKAQAILFKHIASGAESGWDFTSRWFRSGPSNFTSIATGDIIPVDLNSILYRNEALLSQFYDKVGNRTKSEQYNNQANQRLEAMRLYLWKENGWADYDLGQQTSLVNLGERPFIVTDLAGLWYGAYDETLLNGTVIERMLSKHADILWGYPGGIPNNQVASGQQWDFPNIWAPIQFHFTLMFKKLSKDQVHMGEGGRRIWRERTVELAQKFINTTYCGYHNHRILKLANYYIIVLEQFFEKYHAQLVGQPGGGGEYIVQDGFGWTNGVILWLLKEYGDSLFAPKSCPTITSLPEVLFPYNPRTIL